jgi:hypothetical protein
MDAREIKAENWQGIQAQLTGARLRVWQTLYRLNGRNVTSAELAVITGDSILAVRPRLTELVQMGLAECVGRVPVHGKSQGIYRAISLNQAQRNFEESQRPRAEQTMMKLEI